MTFQKAMQIIGFADEEILGVYKLLASILKLGNIKFKKYVTHNGTEGVKIMNQEGAFFLLFLLLLFLPLLSKLDSS